MNRTVFILPPPSPETRKKVLVVDDDRLWLSALVRVLEREGFDVVPASNALNALKTLRESDIDLIVSDVRMPRMDGLELRDEIASRPEKARIPFVFMSGLRADADVEVAEGLGVAHFLEKTGSLGELASLARNLTA